MFGIVRRACAQPVGLPYHVGGLPIEGVGGRVQLRGRAGVGAWMVPSGQYLAEIVFYGHYPRLASASVICTVVVYQMYMTCLSYNKTISTNTVYQGLETELNYMKLVDHG